MGKWQGQPDALRAANRRRTQEALARQEAAKRAAVPAEPCVHAWRNWEYVMGYTHEVRECRVCGYAEMRKVSL